LWILKERIGEGEVLPGPAKVIHGGPSELVRRFREEVVSHAPTWLIGYNNFQFDNLHLAYYWPETFQDEIAVMASGNPSKPGLSSLLDLKHTINADVMGYIDKTRRGMFENISLATVSRELSVGKKLAHPANCDANQLLVYNMMDCELALGIWQKLKLAEEIVALSSTMHAATWDRCQTEGKGCRSAIGLQVPAHPRHVDWQITKQ
jgi:hypothetical protein